MTNDETAMCFTISPELLLAMVSANDLRGRIAGYTFTFRKESRNVSRISPSHCGRVQASGRVLISAGSASLPSSGT